MRTFNIQPSAVIVFGINFPIGGKTANHTFNMKSIGIVVLLSRPRIMMMDCFNLQEFDLDKEIEFW